MPITATVWVLAEISVRERKRDFRGLIGDFLLLWIVRFNVDRLQLYFDIWLEIDRY